MAKVTQEQLMHCTICNKGTRPLGRDKKTFWLMRLIPTIGTALRVVVARKY